MKNGNTLTISTVRKMSGKMMKLKTITTANTTRLTGYERVTRKRRTSKRLLANFG